MVERIIRVSQAANDQSRLFQLTSGVILTWEELVRAVEEGKVVGLTRMNDDNDTDLVSEEDDETLDLISPISEDDLQAYYQYGPRLPNQVDRDGSRQKAP